LHSYINEEAKHIANCLELAILLEVSANKPGNVNLMVGFEGTCYEHFLASAVAASASFEQAAERGIMVSEGTLDVGDVEVGRLIRKCVEDVAKWQHGGNTLLGTVILLMPMAVAAGITCRDKERIFKLLELREKLKLVVESTNASDAVHVYEAIKAANPSGLGKVSELDVNDPKSTKRILEEGISLYRVFEVASGYDNVCSEWVKNYPLTFDVAYPYLTEQIKIGKSLDAAIIHTFLKVLGDHPDTFISRKVGAEKSKQVSLEAKRVLQLGGEETLDGRRSLSEFDLKLRSEGNLLNPGTTADIVSAALALLVLSGFRP
jgi:triphosphoribosyl-dephospho-CoA synthase